MMAVMVLSSWHPEKRRTSHMKRHDENFCLMADHSLRNIGKKHKTARPRRERHTYEMKTEKYQKPTSVDQT
jgi:hypothetical protein